MPRKVTIFNECDWTGCDTVGEDGDGLVVERTIALDKFPAKAFLLCKEHGEALDEILLPLLAAGIKVEAPVKKTTKSSASPTRGDASSGADAAQAGGNGHPREDLPCQEDGCGRILHNRTGMAQHAIRTHGYADLAAYERAHGLVA